ncbi:MAG: ACP S-malonyltransferase [bacterium]|nr:ACP S-malonyltransferase [bacterium]
MICVLFPGQGSQTPGMGRDFYEASDAARAVFDQVLTLTNQQFLDLMFEGPAEELSKSENAQPALLAAEAAIMQHLAAAGVRPASCAGHSFGEFSALLTAGSLDFESAFRLAQERGRCMATDVPEGGMAAVVGLDASAIDDALPEGVEVANYNGPKQTIISGTKAGLAEAEPALKEAGARRVMPLNVAGPFHTSHMREAQRTFTAVLDTIDIRPPATRFVSSVSGKDESDPDAIRTLLSEQICNSVRWTDVMACLGTIEAIEVGPGRVLQGLAKRTDGAPSVRLAGTLDAADALEISE